MKILIILSLLSSCALFTPEKKNTSPGLVTGGDDIAQMSSDEISHHLMRKTTMGGGIYEVSAMPLTTPYLRRQWNEIAQSRALNSKEIKRGEQWHVERLSMAKTCFDFHYSVTRFEQSKELSQWKLSIILDKDTIDLEWIPESQQGKAFVSEVQTPSSPAKRWHNSGIACAPVALPIWHGFTLKITSAYVPWPFSSEAELDWIFEALRPEDEAAVEELRKKNYQPYRGW